MSKKKVMKPKSIVFPPVIQGMFPGGWKPTPGVREHVYNSLMYETKDMTGFVTGDFGKINMGVEPCYIDTSIRIITNATKQRGHQIFYEGKIVLGHRNAISSFLLKLGHRMTTIQNERNCLEEIIRESTRKQHADTTP